MDKTSTGRTGGNSGQLGRPSERRLAKYVPRTEKGRYQWFHLAYYVAYGGYGARAPRDPTLQFRVFGWVGFFFGIAYVLWLQTGSLKPKLVTQTVEWKAAEKEMMIAQKQNPFSGPYSVHLKEQEEKNA